MAMLVKGRGKGREMATVGLEAAFAAPGRKRLIGAQWEVLGEVDSTMDVLRERAQAGAEDGCVVVAESQRAGRGARGSWQCPAGLGLLVSVLCRAGIPRRERKIISIMGAVAAAEAVRASGPPASIKWPNDIVIARKGAALKMRKLGGVLVELIPQGDAAPAHALGIGLNVNQRPDQLPAGVSPQPTSMRIERGGVESDRTAVCRALLERLDFWYGLITRSQQARLVARWRELSCLIGQRTRIRMGSQELEGVVENLQDSGHLLFRDASGRRMELAEGRVKLLLD